MNTNAQVEQHETFLQANPPSVLGLTRWEFDGAGIQFRIWTRPVVSDGGRQVASMVMVWRHPSGEVGRRTCAGMVDAVEHSARVIAGASVGQRLIA